MRDPVAIAKALRDAAAEDATLVDASLGANTLAKTPAAEVWLDTGTMTRYRAAQSEAWGEAHTFLVGFFTPLQNNLQGDEEKIGEVVTSFINRITDPAFDVTLGGLVEQLTVDTYEFQNLTRNGYAFRAGIVTIRAGEL